MSKNKMEVALEATKHTEDLSSQVVNEANKNI